MIAAEGDGSEHVFFVARDDYADWDLAVIGAVGRVERAGAGVEADFSAEMAVEGGFECEGIDVGGRSGGFGHRRYKALFEVLRISARRMRRQGKRQINDATAGRVTRPMERFRRRIL